MMLERQDNFSSTRRYFYNLSDLQIYFPLVSSALMLNSSTQESKEIRLNFHTLLIKFNLVRHGLSHTNAMILLALLVSFKI